ncbi:unnamed protein product [Mytilus coruscus]|uniref:G-protein coupled receptors family 1 profile domain-containing protein n=1 Tax=Mytilus coruscus TaxID=42192 RepID=A0A6J8ER94_MYTCO|nr:unnamed protein product [Mytilus coruscus]
MENKTVIENGYDVPFVGDETNAGFYIGILNFILMISSCIAGLVTVTFSFKYNKKRFMKWRYVDRFIVYKALNDMLYYFSPLCYTVHVTLEKVNYPVPAFCTMYAIISNVFGLSQALLTVTIAVTAFVLVYFNKQLTIGPRDCYLYIIVLIVPAAMFTVLGIFQQLGPNGYFCNYDAVKGRISHLVIVSIGFTLIIVITAVLYIFICIKAYKQSKKIDAISKKESLAKKRTLSIAKHSSLLISAFFFQFGVFILDGIWRAIGTPPHWVYFLITIMSSSGGIVNSIVFYVIRKEKKSSVSPTVTQSREHTGHLNETRTSGTKQKPDSAVQNTTYSAITHNSESGKRTNNSQSLSTGLQECETLSTSV